MDIEYLIWLQNLRETVGGETLMNVITAIPKSLLSALIPAILFWCVNKRAGLFMLFAAGFGRMVNQLIKNTFCIYRPWILDSSVHPTSDAMLKASSYSFPSGHTQGATAIYGSLAYFYRHKFPLLIIPCAVVILAVALSRNYLGVHTPQDVLAAIIETLLVIVVAEKIFDVLERNDRLTSVFIIVGIIVSVLSLIYITTKSYPVDYLNGKVIVSPEMAVVDGVDGVGGALGFFIGWALERQFVNFDINVDLQTKIRRVIIGGIVGGVTMALLLLFKLVADDTIPYEFCKGFLPIIAIIFLGPLAFNFVEHRKLRAKLSRQLNTRRVR